MPLVHVIANQKGGVGKTTGAMNLAAVSYQALTNAPPVFQRTAIEAPGGDPQSPILLVSTDPQQSSTDWANRAEANAGLPFDYAQVYDVRELAVFLTAEKYAHIFVDTPGSLENEDILQAALNYCDDVLVPVVPDPLCFGPTATTIDQVVQPRSIPYRVFINNWDPRDGEADLIETAQFIDAKGWPRCNSFIRRYMVHRRAAANGEVCTQYRPSRVAQQAYADFLNLALELGYGGEPIRRSEYQPAGV